MRKIIAVSLSLCFLSLLVACSDNSVVDSSSIAESKGSVSSASINDSAFIGEITLDFSFGTRTGTYEGDINDNGLPDGYGIFTSTSSDGTNWTYEGDWIDGHWEGSGTSIWSTGQSYIGGYSGDESSGSGIFTFENGICFRGEFTDSSNASGYITNPDGSTYYADIIDGDLNVYGVYRNGGFNSDLDQFQGEWDEIDSKYGRLVISGETVPKFV